MLDQTLLASIIRTSSEYFNMKHNCILNINFEFVFVKTQCNYFVNCRYILFQTPKKIEQRRILFEQQETVCCKTLYFHPQCNLFTWCANCSRQSLKIFATFRHAISQSKTYYKHIFIIQCCIQKSFRIPWMLPYMRKNSLQTIAKDLVSTTIKN